MEARLKLTSPVRFLAIGIALMALVGLATMLIPAAPAEAAAKRIGLADNSAVAGATKLKPERPPRSAALPPGILFEAGFEQGLVGWNTAGVGEVIPSVVDGDVRAGAGAGRVLLTGGLSRSELILGGNGGPSTSGDVKFTEGSEYWYGFSFNILQMVWGEPGAHNLIMQFKSDGTGSPNFGLDLWDYAGDDGNSGGRGLWSEGDAMDGNRFLAPLSERAWHDIAVHFRASSQEQGFYEVFLDGRLVDARSGVNMIVPGRSYAYIKNGLYRNGETAPGTSELLLDSAKLGTSLQAVNPS